MMKIELCHEKTCFCHMRTTKADCYSLLRWYNTSSFYIQILKPIAVAEQAGLSLNWSEIPKTGFLVTRLN